MFKVCTTKGDKRKWKNLKRIDISEAEESLQFQRRGKDFSILGFTEQTTVLSVGVFNIQGEREKLTQGGRNFLKITSV